MKYSLPSIVLLAALSFPSLCWNHTQEGQRAPEGSTAPADELDAVLGHLRDAHAALVRTREASNESIDLERLTKIHQLNLQIAGSVRDLNQRLEREARASTPPHSPHAYELSSAWVDDILALGEGSSARREAALQRVREALLGTDETAQLAALDALNQVGTVEFDKASFRPLVLPIATAARGARLVPALHALRNTASEEGDLDLVYAAWERDPQAIGHGILNLLKVFGKQRLEGRSEEIALEVLLGYELRGDNASIAGLWGAHVGPKLEARVLELARNEDHEVRHGAIYFGLSTFPAKSPAVVEALIGALTDTDFNSSGRALWGLGHGVPTESHARVVDALVELHNGRSSPSVRSDCRRIVKQYGGDAGLTRLAS